METEYDKNGVISVWNPNIPGYVTIERLYKNTSFIINDIASVPPPHRGAAFDVGAIYIQNDYI